MGAFTDMLLPDKASGEEGEKVDPNDEGDPLPGTARHREFYPEGVAEVLRFDRLKLRWYVVSVTSTPGKVYKVVDACRNVLRGLHDSKIAQRELDQFTIRTAITIAEILKKKGLAIEKRILMSTVDMKDESKGRLIPKVKIEVLLGKTEKFDDLMVAVASKGRQLETIKHDDKP